jgi:hypothetical protein
MGHHPHKNLDCACRSTLQDVSQICRGSKLAESFSALIAKEARHELHQTEGQHACF